MLCSYDKSIILKIFQVMGNYNIICEKLGYQSTFSKIKILIKHNET